MGHMLGEVVFRSLTVVLIDSSLRHKPVQFSGSPAHLMGVALDSGRTLYIPTDLKITLLLSRILPTVLLYA